MFRLPTHLESFIPPPRDQVPTSRPWTGTLQLPPTHAFAAQSLFCTVAETEGENSHVELWPSRFDVQIIRQTPLLQEVQAWVRANTPPMCMFMPARVAEGEGHKTNQAGFEAFAAMLAENQLVAIVPWNAPDRLSGGGIIIFPTRASRALLVGAVFLHVPFPDFMAGLVPAPSRPSIAIPRSLIFNSPSQQHAIPNIATSQRHSTSQSPSSSRGGRFSG
ncbi:hypothetical protein QCA50_016731 [Cerrena zonata]|uniref:Uncharacterized protein n=1 Tax=Cerrena zonata TaxID=2478898 RepID=A0AAW0FLN3_9APHY